MSDLISDHSTSNSIDSSCLRLTNSMARHAFRNVQSLSGERIAEIINSEIARVSSDSSPSPKKVFSGRLRRRLMAVLGEDLPTICRMSLFDAIDELNSSSQDGFRDAIGKIVEGYNDLGPENFQKEYFSRVTADSIIAITPLTKRAYFDLGNCAEQAPSSENEDDDGPHKTVDVIGAVLDHCGVAGAIVIGGSLWFIGEVVGQALIITLYNAILAFFLEWGATEILVMWLIQLAAAICAFVLTAVILVVVLAVCFVIIYLAIYGMAIIFGAIGDVFRSIGEAIGSFFSSLGSAIATFFCNLFGGNKDSSGGGSSIMDLGQGDGSRLPPWLHRFTAESTGGIADDLRDIAVDMVTSYLATKSQLTPMNV